jgi:hypothetical protein
MKPLFTLLLFGILIFFARPVLAQRNVVNVPTSQIVQKPHMFFQEQVTILQGRIQSGTVFTWGLGKNFEAGFNLQELTINHLGKPYIVNDRSRQGNSLDVMFNFQKGFEVKDWLVLAIGTMSGTNIPGRNNPNWKFSTFTYGNILLSVPNTSHCITLGGFYSNVTYAGLADSPWGFMASLNAELVKDKLQLTADFIPGSKSFSSVNAGFQVPISEKWQFALVAQFPSPGSNNQYGGVVEISRR